TVRVGNAAGTTYGVLYFDGTQTLGGSGAVGFGANGSNAVYETAFPGGTLTVGAGGTGRGNSGALSGFYAGDPRGHQGPVAADGRGAGSFGYDRGFSTGITAATALAIDTAGVADAAPPEVYQTARAYYDFGYALAGLTPGAAYTVRLHFAEFQVAAAGQR